MVGVDHPLNQRAALDTRISTAWCWWCCGDPRICPGWLAEHVIFWLTEDKPGSQYHVFLYDLLIPCPMVLLVLSLLALPVILLAAAILLL